MTRAYNAEAFGHLLITMSGIKDTEFNLAKYYHDNCGCAVGHAGRDEYFMQQGFVLKPVKDSPLGAHILDTGAMVPFYNDKWAMEAVAELFGLTVYEACTLFVPSFYEKGSSTDRHVVLSRIRYFCDLNKLVLSDETVAALSARHKSDIDVLQMAYPTMDNFARSMERLRNAFDNRGGLTLPRLEPGRVDPVGFEGSSVDFIAFDEASGFDFAAIERRVLSAMVPRSEFLMGRCVTLPVA